MQINQKVAGSAGAVAAAAAAAAGGASSAAAQTGIANWQGPYVGAQGGISWLHSDPSGSNASIGPAYAGYTGHSTESVGSANATAPQLGALVGWNFQNQNLVFGPEVGLSWMGGKAQKGGTMNNVYSGGGSTYSYAGSTTRTSRIKAVLDIAGTRRLGLGRHPALFQGRLRARGCQQLLVAQFLFVCGKRCELLDEQEFLAARLRDRRRHRAADRSRLVGARRNLVDGFRHEKLNNPVPGTQNSRLLCRRHRRTNQVPGFAVQRDGRD